VFKLYSVIKQIIIKYIIFFIFLIREMIKHNLKKKSNSEVLNPFLCIPSFCTAKIGLNLRSNIDVNDCRSPAENPLVVCWQRHQAACSQAPGVAPASRRAATTHTSASPALATGRDVALPASCNVRGSVWTDACMADGSAGLPPLPPSWFSLSFFVDAMIEFAVDAPSCVCGVPG
jgi:hypothetical protein